MSKVDKITELINKYTMELDSTTIQREGLKQRKVILLKVIPPMMREEMMPL